MFPPSPRHPPSKAVPKAVVHARTRGSLLKLEVSSLFLIVDKMRREKERKKKHREPNRGTNVPRLTRNETREREREQDPP